jgi:hypothetical protein
LRCFGRARACQLCYISRMEANIMGVHGGEFRACPISASVH